MAMWRRFVWVAVAGTVLGCQSPQGPSQGTGSVALVPLARSVGLIPEDSDQIRLASYTLSGEKRNGIFLHPPNRLVFPPQEVQAGSELHFDHGVVEKAWKRGSDGVVFRVLARPVNSGDEPAVVFENSLKPRDDGGHLEWNHGMVVFTAEMSGAVEITLETLPGEDGHRDFDWAVWSDLVLLPPAAELEHQNVVLITLDTTRADRLSLYREDLDTTPFLSELAAESMVFERAYTTSTWTLPAHASLFTGLYPEQHGAIDVREGALVGQPLDRSHTTLAEVLQSDGYLTLGVVGGPFLRRHYQLDQGFLYYSDLWEGLHRNAGQLNRLAFRWLDRHEGRPFFLFLNYFDPHAPYDPDGYPATDEAVFAELGFDIHTFQPAMLRERGIGGLPAEATAALRRRYDAELRQTDRSLRELVEGLRDRGLLENTLVALVADHGESFGEHGLWGHGGPFFDEQARVPMLLRIPGETASPKRIAKPVSTAVLARLILRHLDVSAPPSLTGLPGGPEEAPVLGARFSPRGTGVRMFVEYPLKYLAWIDDAEGGSRRRLFDLEADPGETEDLSEADPALLEAVVNRLEGIRSHLRVPDTVIADQADQDEDVLDPDEEEKLREQLKALGYVN
jgi:arylsulfatase A-like enzyme